MFLWSVKAAPSSVAGDVARGGGASVGVKHMTIGNLVRLIARAFLARSPADRSDAKYRSMSWFARRCGFRLHNPNLKWIEEDTSPTLMDTLERPVEMNDRKRILQSLARSVAELPGDTAECGVFEGASGLVICDAMVAHEDYRHHAFDSFEGLSEPQLGDVTTQEKMVAWKKGDLHALLGVVQKNLSRFHFVAYHKGWIPDRFSDVDDRRFKFVHIDVDLYQPRTIRLSFSTLGCFREASSFATTMVPRSVRAPSGP